MKTIRKNIIYLLILMILCSCSKNNISGNYTMGIVVSKDGQPKEYCTLINQSSNSGVAFDMYLAKDGTGSITLFGRKIDIAQYNDGVIVILNNGTLSPIQYEERGNNISIELNGCLLFFEKQHN